MCTAPPAPADKELAADAQAERILRLNPCQHLAGNAAQDTP
jgi:hypothetical protein